MINRLLFKIIIFFNYQAEYVKYFNYLKELFQVPLFYEMCVKYDSFSGNFVKMLKNRILNHCNPLFKMIIKYVKENRLVNLKSN